MPRSALLTSLLLLIAAIPLGVPRAHLPDRPPGAEATLSTPQNVAPSPLPAVRNPNGQGYLWRPAGDLVDPGGELSEDAPAWLAASPARGPKGGECVVPQVIIKEAWGTDQTWPRDLDEFVSRAVAVLIGTVVAAEPGFLFNDEAGVMLTMAVASRAKSARGYRGPELHIFYPQATFTVASHRVCRSGSYLPPPPEVGSRVIFAPRRDLLQDSPAISELLRTGVEILSTANGKLQVPTALEGLREISGSDSASFRRLAARVRAIARRQARQ